MKKMRAIGAKHRLAATDGCIVNLTEMSILPTIELFTRPILSAPIIGLDF